MEEGSAGGDTARSRTITTWDDDDGDGEVVDALGNGEDQSDETESSSPQAVNGNSMNINGDNGQVQKGMNKIFSVIMLKPQRNQICKPFKFHLLGSLNY